MSNNNNKNNTWDTILGIIGVFSLVTIAYQTFKAISEKTETNVISDDALKALNSPKQAEKLRKVVEEYHETGDWNKKELETIL